MIAYFDTSAVVALMIDEPSTAHCQRLWNEATRVVSVRLLYAEARAAMARAARTSVKADASHDLQLQVYASAGRREGLDVRGAYVHDLKHATRSNVDVSGDAVTTAEAPVA